jgi:hypothetical protein
VQDQYVKLTVPCGYTHNPVPVVQYDAEEKSRRHREPVPDRGGRDLLPVALPPDVDRWDGARFRPYKKSDVMKRE